MANTRIPGTIIRSGSIPTTALGGGVVSSSAQVINHINNQKITPAQITASGHIVPSATEIYDLGSSNLKFRDLYLSGSTIYLGTLALSDSGGTLAVSPSGSPAGTTSPVSGSFTGSFFGDIYATNGVISSSAQVIASLPTNTVSASAQVTAFLPTGTVSSSGQVDITNTTNYTSFSSSIATIDTTQTSRLAALENVTGSYATTGSNTFVAPQTISDTTNSTSYLDGALHVAGGMSVRKDVRISGSLTVNGLLTAVSMSTQYVTASQYNVGVSKITLNDDDTVRFAGISIYDSGSSSPTSASIFWDSLQHRFIYENLSGSSYNSSIIIAGPKHTGSLGDEPTLTSGYIPVATGTDHIDNSVMLQSGSNIGVGVNPTNAKLEVVATSGEVFRADAAGGAYRIVANQTGVIMNGNVGIGTTSPSYLLDVQKSDAGNVVDFRITNTESANAASGTRAIVQTNGASVGDPRLVLSVAGVREYSLGIDNSDSDKFKINDGSDPSSGTTHLTIDTSGNVSLGTSTTVANEKLLVYTNANSRNKVMIRNDSSGSSARAELVVNAYGNSWGLGMGSSANNSNAFYIRSDSNDTDTVRVSISTSGNVGIGITNPNDYANGFVTISKPSANDDTVLTLRNAASPVAGGGQGTIINFVNDTGSNTALAYIQTRTNDGGTNGETSMRFGTWNGSALGERMRIKSNGYVGIGTTNPITLLHVKGTDSLTANTRYIKGWVGGAGTWGANSYEELGVGFSGIRSIYISSDNWDLAFSTGTSTTFNAGTQSERMRIDSSGNVGIGTNNPSQQLHLTGYARLYGISVNETGGTVAGFIGYEKAWVGGSLNNLAISSETGNNISFFTNGSATLRMTLNTSGHLLPGANGTQNLGSDSLRWATVFTSDLSLSNGIGDWTIVEGEDDLFIYNNKNNKVYKFTLQEVDPSTATPKKS